MAHLFTSCFGNAYSQLAFSRPNDFCYASLTLQVQSKVLKAFAKGNCPLSEIALKSRWLIGRTGQLLEFTGNMSWAEHMSLQDQVSASWLRQEA